MTKSVTERGLVLALLMDITKNHVPCHIALRNVLGKYQYMDKKERSFITRVTEGTLEHMLEIDYIINQFSKTKVNKMKPVIRNLIRSAVYQLKYMDSVPNSAVCNEAVKLAKKKGFATLGGFVNGVLRNIARNLDDIRYPDESDLKEYLEIKYSMPAWILNQWLPIYGRETTEKMLLSFQEETPLCIRCNLAKTTPEQLKKELQAEGAEVKEHPYLPYAFYIWGYDYLGELASFREGLFYVQDISSMMVAEAANPEKGDKIIDVCAAPGGKSLHLAQKLEGTGDVEARDLTEYKVELIEENIFKSGLSNIHARQMDALVSDEDSLEKADIVIADLPCSGLGVIGKKPDLKYNMTKEQAEELAALQRKMLSIVKNYVKPGGTLIYSTCTVREEENMGNVRWFLETFPEFSAASVEETFSDVLKGEVKEGCVQFLPGVHKSDGFFLAKFQKRGQK